MSTSQTTREASPKIALITGAGRRRIGNIVARHLAAKQTSIALHYYSSKDSALETREEIRALGARCEVYQADVSVESETNDLVRRVVNDFGGIDVLVNTSSLWSKTRLEDVTADDLRRDFDVNAIGTFLCSRAAGLQMVAQPTGGSIVTIGDWAIDRPYLDHVAYFISKGTIPTMTRLLAVELASRNPKVRVNCIHPGPVMFPPDADEAEREELIRSTLVKDADCPESMAQAVEFLIENKFVTGTCLPVDGGRSVFSSDEGIRARST